MSLSVKSGAGLPMSAWANTRVAPRVRVERISVMFFMVTVIVSDFDAPARGGIRRSVPVQGAPCAQKSGSLYVFSVPAALKAWSPGFSRLGIRLEPAGHNFGR